MSEPTRVRAARDILRLGSRAAIHEGEEGTLLSRYEERIPYAPPLRRAVVRWDNHEGVWDEPAAALLVLA